MGISRPLWVRRHSTHSRTLSIARSTSTSESTSGFPPSRAAPGPVLASLLHEGGRAPQNVDPPRRAEPTVAVAKQLVRGLQCPLDASRSGPADRGNGRPIEGGKDLDVLPFGLSPGDQQGKMLCHDTLF